MLPLLSDLQKEKLLLPPSLAVLHLDGERVLPAPRSLRKQEVEPTLRDGVEFVILHGEDEVRLYLKDPTHAKEGIQVRIGVRGKLI